MENKEKNFIEDPISRLGGDKVIWIIAVLLSLISMAVTYSAGTSKAFMDKTTNFDILIDHSQFILMGLVAMFVCYKIPLIVYRKLIPIVFLASFVLVIITPIFGTEYNSAKRWLDIGPIRFMPSEIIKTTLILYLARAYEVWEFKNFKDFFIKITLPIGIICAVIMMSSMSTTVYIGALSLLILFYAGTKREYIVKTCLIGVAALAVMLLVNGAILKPFFNKDLFPRVTTSINRITTFTKSDNSDKEKSKDEIEKERNDEHQSKMARIAISSSGILWGKGPGNSTQRYVLPHPYSDFIYAIIIEEYGLLFGVFVMMLYVWLLYRCVIIVQGCTRKFTAISVGGLGLMITSQALLHIGVNVGLLPVTGHTLPLISLGGTSFVLFSCAFGIILSVSRTVDISKAKEEEKRIKEAELKRIEDEKRAIEAQKALERRREAELKAAIEAEEERKAIENHTKKSEEIILHDIIDSRTGEFK